MDNKAIVFVGMGGHALVVLDALLASGRRAVGYCERGEKEKAKGKGLPFLGEETSKSGVAALTSHSFLVSIGDNKTRETVSESLVRRGFQEALPIIHPTVTLGSGVALGRGAQVQGGVIINADCTVGRSVILNTGCIIEHECQIGAFAHIGPGAVLAGNVHVGQGAFVGANATVIQGITIGEGAVVGAGAVVLKDVPSGRTIVGNPGRLLPDEK